MKVQIVSILPSPYQRDLLGAWHGRGDCAVAVDYLERSCYDSPWPEKPLRGFERVLGAPHVRLGPTRFHFSAVPLKWKQADVIVLNGYMHTAAQWILRRSSDWPPLVFWGERMRGEFGGIKGWLQGSLSSPIRYCSGIAGIGQLACVDYERRYPGVPQANIPYYTSVVEFSALATERARGNDITVLFCGQMIERKGIDVLLKVFARLAPRFPHCRLRLVGREADIGSRLKCLPPEVCRRIETVGFVPPEALPQEFAAADLFVLPSRFDGWGVVVNQAVASGLPVLTTDAVGAAYDLVEDGVNGRVVPAGIADSLEAALAWYLEDATRLTEASKNAMQRLPELQPETGAARWVSFLQGILNR